MITGWRYVVMWIVLVGACSVPIGLGSTPRMDRCPQRLEPEEPPSLLNLIASLVILRGLIEGISRVNVNGKTFKVS